MLQKRTVVLLLLALVFGGLAALVAYKRVQQPVQATEATRPVVVAAFDIDYGIKIDAQMIRLVAWPTASLPEGAYGNAADVVGKIASAAIGKGEPITARRAVETLTGSSLASLISPNMRALTVRVNDVIGVAGFLLPGNHVDVLATPKPRGSERPVTKTLLQNLKVLAVDQQARAAKDDPIVVRAVTVEVDPAQAELIVQATEEGSVQLVLRNPLDQAVDAPVAKPAPVAEAPKPRPRPKPVQISAPPPPPKPDPITVIRGTASEDSELSR